MEEDDDFGALYENIGVEEGMEAGEDELDYDDREYAGLPVGVSDDEDEDEEEEMLYGTPATGPPAKKSIQPTFSVSTPAFVQASVASVVGAAAPATAAAAPAITAAAPSIAAAAPATAAAAPATAAAAPATAAAVPATAAAAPATAAEASATAAAAPAIAAAAPATAAAAPAKAAAAPATAVASTGAQDEVARSSNQQPTIRRGEVEDDDGEEDDLYAQLYGEAPSSTATKTETAMAVYTLSSSPSPHLSAPGVVSELFWPTRAAYTEQNAETSKLPGGEKVDFARTACEAEIRGVGGIEADAADRICNREVQNEFETSPSGIENSFGGNTTLPGAVASHKDTREVLIGEHLFRVARGEREATTDGGSTQEKYEQRAADQALGQGAQRSEFCLNGESQKKSLGEVVEATSLYTQDALGVNETVPIGKIRTADEGSFQVGRTDISRENNDSTLTGVVRQFNSVHVRQDGLKGEWYDSNVEDVVEGSGKGVQESGIHGETETQVDVVGHTAGSSNGVGEGGYGVDLEGPGPAGLVVETGSAGPTSVEELIEQAQEGDMDWVSGLKGDGIEAAVEDEDESGSEDDLQIVLNEEPPLSYAGRGPYQQMAQQQHLHSAALLGSVNEASGFVEGEEFEDSEDDDDLVIVADEPLADGDDPWARSQPLTESGAGGAPSMPSLEGEQVGAVQGVAEQRSTALLGQPPVGPRGALSGARVAGQPVVSPYMKYVRPGAANALTGVTATTGPAGPAIGGATGETGPGTAGRSSGAGRGDWAWGSAQQRHAWGGETVREFMLPPNKSLFEVNVDELEDKPWRRPQADVSDYFNFDLNESSWQEYCRQLAQLKEEATGSKIRVYESNRGEQEYDPELPPELAAAAGIPERGGPSTDGGGKGRGGQVQLLGRAIQVEGGGGERRPSSDMRRQRPLDPDVIIEIKLLNLDDFGNPLPEPAAPSPDNKKTPKLNQKSEGTQGDSGVMLEGTAADTRMKDDLHMKEETLQQSHGVRSRQSTPQRSGMSRPPWPVGEEGGPLPNGMWERMPLLPGPGMRRGGGPIRGGLPMGPGHAMGPMAGIGPMGLQGPIGPGHILPLMGPGYPPGANLPHRLLPNAAAFGGLPPGTGLRPSMMPPMGPEDHSMSFGAHHEFQGGTRAVERMSPPSPPATAFHRKPLPDLHGPKRGSNMDDETRAKEHLVSSRNREEESEEESEDEDEDEDDEGEDEQEENEEDEEEAEMENQKERARREAAMHRRNVPKERSADRSRPKAKEWSPPQSLSDENRFRKRESGDWGQGEESAAMIESRSRRKAEDRVAVSRPGQDDQFVRRTTSRDESSRLRRTSERSNRVEERSVASRDRESARTGKGWNDAEWKESGRSPHGQTAAVNAVYSGRSGVRGERGPTSEGDRRQDRGSWEEPPMRNEPRKGAERAMRREDGLRERKRPNERAEEAIIRMERGPRYSSDPRSVADRVHGEEGKGGRGESLKESSRRRALEDERSRESRRSDNVSRPVEVLERGRRVEKDKRRDAVNDRPGTRSIEPPDDRNAERLHNRDRDRERERERERERTSDRERNSVRDSRGIEWEQTRPKKRRTEDWAREAEPSRVHRHEDHAAERGVDSRGPIASSGDWQRRGKRGQEGGEEHERTAGENIVDSGQRHGNGVAVNKRRVVTEDEGTAEPSEKTKRRRSDDHVEVDASSHPADRKDHEATANGRRKRDRIPGAMETGVGSREDVGMQTGRVGRSRFERWNSVKSVEEDRDVDDNNASAGLGGKVRDEMSQRGRDVPDKQVDREASSRHLQGGSERPLTEHVREMGSRHHNRHKAAENVQAKDPSTLKEALDISDNQPVKTEKVQRREAGEGRNFEGGKKEGGGSRPSVSSAKDMKTGVGRVKDEGGHPQDTHPRQSAQGNKEKAPEGLEIEEVRKRRRERFGPIGEDLVAKASSAKVHDEEAKADRPARKRRWA